MVMPLLEYDGPPLMSFRKHSSQASRRKQTPRSRRVFLFLFLIVSSLTPFAWIYSMETSSAMVLSMEKYTQALHFNQVENIPLSKPVYELEQLKKQRLLHGTFFFGRHSQEIEIDSNYKPKWNSIQKQMLDDDTINVEKEKERCERYGYSLSNETHPRRRRLFLGALIADDSMKVIEAVGTEAYNIFHTVSFIESNVTQNQTPRKWKYNNPPSDELNELYQLFGPKTKVSVDYYVTALKEKNDMLMEFLFREGNTYRWALNEMRKDDVGILLDADETFSRDFLRAMQICDVPAFRPDQNCRKPKVIASTMVMESSPNCITKDRRWFHPDAILGECVEQVGNSTLHPPTKRQWNDRHGRRLPGYGQSFNYSMYVKEGLGPNNMYPLWAAVDFRMEEGGEMVEMADASPTGYHFHNFFESAEEIQFKYHTYGHPQKNAMDVPIWELDIDLHHAVDCARGTSKKTLDFNESGSSALPIYFMNEEVRKNRHQLWQNIVKADEERWNKKSNDEEEAHDAAGGKALTYDHAPSSNNPSHDEPPSISSNFSDWDSSNCAVLGLATGLSLESYKNFVGSWRSTGNPATSSLGLPKMPQRM